MYFLDLERLYMFWTAGLTAVLVFEHGCSSDIRRCYHSNIHVYQMQLNGTIQLDIWPSLVLTGLTQCQGNFNNLLWSGVTLLFLPVDVTSLISRHPQEAKGLGTLVLILCSASSAITCLDLCWSKCYHVMVDKTKKMPQCPQTLSLLLGGGVWGQDQDITGCSLPLDML